MVQGMCACLIRMADQSGMAQSMLGLIASLHCKGNHLVKDMQAYGAHG